MTTASFRSALAVAVLAAACGRAPAATVADAASPSGGDIVVRVNGVAIDRAEVPGANREGSSPHGDGAPESEAAAIDRAVTEELLAQHAVADGLDRDPVYVAELRRAEARFRAWRRAQLAALAERRAGAEPVTEEEARRYFDANAARMRSEVMVAQMLIRDEAAANAALQEIRGGASFDDVARRLHPSADPTARPWEMGYLRWNQIPDPWRPALGSLAPGQVSDVIPGPNRRFWIVKLLNRREAADVTFESVRPLIEQTLAEASRTAARDRLRDALRRGARIERPAPAAPPR